MVRQFVDTRRSHLGLVLSTDRQRLGRRRRVRARASRSWARSGAPRSCRRPGGHGAQRRPTASRPTRPTRCSTPSRASSRRPTGSRLRELVAALAAVHPVGQRARPGRRLHGRPPGRAGRLRELRPDVMVVLALRCRTGRRRHPPADRQRVAARDRSPRGPRPGSSPWWEPADEPRRAPGAPAPAEPDGPRRRRVRLQPDRPRRGRLRNVFAGGEELTVGIPATCWSAGPWATCSRGCASRCSLSMACGHRRLLRPRRPARPPPPGPRPAFLPSLDAVSGWPTASSTAGSGCSPPCRRPGDAGDLLAIPYLCGFAGGAAHGGARPRLPRPGLVRAPAHGRAGRQRAHGHQGAGLAAAPGRGVRRTHHRLGQRPPPPQPIGAARGGLPVPPRRRRRPPRRVRRQRRVRRAAPARRRSRPSGTCSATTWSLRSIR